jgi:hypothetical protein
MADLYLLGHVLLHRALEDRSKLPRRIESEHDDGPEPRRSPALRSVPRRKGQPSPSNAPRSAM